jgi:hypothetical protein
MLGSGQQHAGNEHGVTSPSGSMLLPRGQSGLPRLSSVVPGAAAGDPNASNKQSDMYITELLSYSLDRLRKVWALGRVITLLAACSAVNVQLQLLSLVCGIMSVVHCRPTLFAAAYSSISPSAMCVSARCLHHLLHASIP